MDIQTSATRPIDSVGLLQLAAQREQTARQLLARAQIRETWEEAGAEVHLVGSLRMGLMMNHRDIDLHIYSDPLELEASFGTMARLAADPALKRIECINLIDTEEACIEWHAWYAGPDDALWQLDMIHIQKGSRYEGYFERMADRIQASLTPETRETILRLKYETPEEQKIAGIEYYQAVLRDGIRTYDDFQNWRQEHPLSGIITWIP